MTETTYVVHADRTDITITGGFHGKVVGFENACQVARKFSEGGREAVVHTCIGQPLKAYHSGREMDTSEVYIDYARIWTELYDMGQAV